MAEEKEKKSKGKEEHESKEGKREGGKKKKLHLHQIITTRAKDGSFGHEHIYKEHPDDVHSRPPVFAGTSQDMEDLHQHMDDHFGGGAEEGQGEPDGDEGQGAPPAAGAGAQPQE
jgi:hypothetical protein